MPKRSRDKQLAKLAAATPGRAPRRQAAPRSHHRAGRRRHRVDPGGGRRVHPVRRGRSDRCREPFGVGSARNPDRNGDAGSSRAGDGRLRREGAAEGRQAQATVRGAAAADDRPLATPTPPRSRPRAARSRSSCWPKTATERVNSFVFLAQQGFYDGQTFHRIAEGLRDPGRRPARRPAAVARDTSSPSPRRRVSASTDRACSPTRTHRPEATGVSSSSRWPRRPTSIRPTASTRSSATSRRGRMCSTRSRPCPRRRVRPGNRVSRPKPVYINSVTIDGVLGATAGPRSVNPSPP